MRQSGHIRPALARSLDRALVAVGVAGVIIGLLELAAMPLGAPGGGLLIGMPFVFWSYLFAGLVAWHRRPSNPIGALILWVGVAVFLGGVGNTNIPALIGVSTILRTLPLAAMIHLLLAFPSGRLLTRPAKMLAAFVYVFSLVLAAPAYLFHTSGAFPPFAVVDLPTVVAASRTLESLGGLAIVVATVTILAARLLRADRRHRRVLVPLFSYGIVAVSFIPFSSLVLGGILGMDPMLRGGLQFLVVGALPIAFVFGILRGGFAQTGELIELGSWLGTAQSGRDELRAALARTLGDPTLTLWFGSADGRTFVDAAGIARGDDDPRNDTRGWEEIRLEERTIGAIDYDAALLADSVLVRTAGNVIAIAIERERLTTELLASRRELVRSRERIINAADHEHHRIARNLHDGLQVQLLLLALDAQRLATAIGTASSVQESAIRLRQDIDTAAGSLRTLVHDLVPAALIERGLGAAAEDLVDRMPIPTRLQVDLLASRLPRSVENTAYFVIAEALTNVVKHSHASTASVRLRQEAGTLHIQVRDDGIGGARVENGTGMRGLQDRVEALGGEMELISKLDAGATLRVELPCAS